MSRAAVENEASTAADSVHRTEDTSEAGPASAANAACENAAEIVENAAGFGNAATVFGNLADGEPSPFSLACSNTAGLGNILYYHANVATGSILVADARRNDLGEPLPIHLASSCSSRQCLADALGQARYSNSGTAATDVIIKIGSGTMASGALPFELQVAILPLATNAVCASAKPVTAGTPVDDDTSFGATASLPCAGSSVGTLYFSIAVPAGMSLTADVTPADPFDAHWVILDTCGAGSCLAEGTRGQAAEFANASASARPVIVAVSGQAKVGRFTLNVTLH